MAPEHPLLARVTVNRFWQQVFGTGLVKSSHDFGTQGDLPSHPELLDGLALHFQQSGWNVKGLMRLMLTSKPSAGPVRPRRKPGRPIPITDCWPEGPGSALMPSNCAIRRFLQGVARSDHGRARGESLSTAEYLGAGRLHRIQHPELCAERGNRSPSSQFVYLLKRTAPAPFMINFDAPSREQACTRRERSNTPLQALQLMNDVQHFEAARALAERTLLWAEPRPNPASVSPAAPC